MTDLQTTPLHPLHKTLGAKMVPFAGFDMPVSYPFGLLKEHLHTRENAGLFDVSHMGQVRIDGDTAEAAAFLERLTPSNYVDLKSGRQRYGLLTNAQGGIDDDLMAARYDGFWLVVVNAANKERDFAWLKENCPDGLELTLLDRALIALQGPKSEMTLGAQFPDLTDTLENMKFMDVREATVNGETIYISRSGYTGEDGFEISLPSDVAAGFAETLLAHDNVEPIGLGARDSLRLEAGLCLHGHDINAATPPVMANLGWAVSKARRQDGKRAGGFTGAETVLNEFLTGTDYLRVGLRPDGRAPIREGVKLYKAQDSEKACGHVSSGSFGPSIGAPVAMGYVPRDLAEAGSTLYADLRGKRIPVTVAALPFIPAQFKK